MRGVTNRLRKVVVELAEITKQLATNREKAKQRANRLREYTVMYRTDCSRLTDVLLERGYTAHIDNLAEAINAFDKALRTLDMVISLEAKT